MTDALTGIRGLNLSAIAFAIGVAALGHALQISSGTYNLDALWWLSLAFGFCLLGALTHRLSVTWSRIRRSTWQTVRFSQRIIVSTHKIRPRHWRSSGQKPNSY